MERKERLRAGIAAMGPDISETAQDRLLAYVDLLKKWNKTYNLTALRDEEKMIVHHLLDSLTLLPYIEGAQTMLDVGSGGGQPGIPAAVCRPDVQITLLDANTKKTAFLRQAADFPLRIYALHRRPVAAVFQQVRRPRHKIRQFRKRTAGNHVGTHVRNRLHAPRHHAHIVQPQLDSRLPQDVCVEKVQRLDVPGLDAERHIVILSKR